MQDTVPDNVESVIQDMSAADYVSPVYRLKTQFWSDADNNTITVTLPAAAEAIRGAEYIFEVIDLVTGGTEAVTLRDSVLGPSSDPIGPFTLDAKEDHLVLTPTGSQWVVVDNQIA